MCSMLTEHAYKRLLKCLRTRDDISKEYVDGRLRNMILIVVRKQGEIVQAIIHESEAMDC